MAGSRGWFGFDQHLVLASACRVGSSHGASRGQDEVLNVGLSAPGWQIPLRTLGVSYVCVRKRVCVCVSVLASWPKPNVAPLASFGR